jgi:TRAP-type C4-dicarboxylate transport system substrate-binding protein
MKRILSLGLLIIIVVSGLIISGCSSNTPAPANTSSTTVATQASSSTPTNTIELRFNSYSTPMHPLVTKVYQPWATELGNRTNGRVKATVFPGAVLGKPIEAYDMVLHGTVDLSQISFAYLSNTLPLCGVFELPYVVPDDDSTLSATIRDTLMQKYIIPLQFTGVKILWYSRVPATEIVSVKKPVRTLEDLKGLIVGVPGGKIMTSQVIALGASPEMVTVPDSYTALERGMVDAQLTPLETVHSMKLDELAKYITMADIGGTVIATAMNLDTWNSLPLDIQKTIEDMNPWAQDLQAKIWQPVTDQGLSAAQAASIEVINLSQDEQQRWAQATSSIVSDWETEKDAAGLPATQMVNEAKQLKAQSGS